jgi:thiamine pyrophosphate-dependent acetolactate synthase large subunit-like protein
MQANYERIASAFGCQGYLARSIEEVKKSVQSALAEKVHPSIINVFIEPSSGRVQQVCLFSFNLLYIFF